MFLIVSGKVNSQILSMMIERKRNTWSTQKCNHDINRINAEKLTSTEASMTKLRDIMKNMKETYDSKPAANTSQIREMMNTMFAQADAIRQERPVTAENLTNIVVNYLVRSGLDF